MLAFLLLFLFFGAWRFAWGKALPADDVSQLIGREAIVVDGVFVEVLHVRQTAQGVVHALYGGGEARARLSVKKPGIRWKIGFSTIPTRETEGALVGIALLFFEPFLAFLTWNLAWEMQNDRFDSIP